MLTFADLAMDLAAHRVKRNGQDILLGPTEFRMLRHLMQHPGRVFTREQLLDSVWRRDVYVEPRTVDRSAAHPSELPSLIRTSYALFCLKKKQHTLTKHSERPNNRTSQLTVHPTDN